MIFLILKAIIIKKAGGLNPNHPESKETEGVIEESTGDPKKAAEDYQESMENAINPFTEQLIKNNKGQTRSPELDYEKLKKSITIYEYFPKDWIKIPVLSDNVSGYERDMQVKNGYSKMIDDLEDKLDALKEASENEANVLMDKGEDAFVKEMMKEFGWGFIESCYKYFSHDQPSATITDEAFNTKVKQLFDYILTDVKWMADIKAISLKEGLSTDSIAMKQAQYLISEEMKKNKN